VPAAFAVEGGGLVALRPRSFIGASRDMMAIEEDQPGLIARYRGLRTGVGVLFGTGDRVLDPDVHAQGLAGVIEGVEIEMIEGAGHMLPVTRVGETAAFIRRQAGRVAA
jgi:pimeloyl-ACP methyl ester carboxylesterase